MFRRIAKFFGFSEAGVEKPRPELPDVKKRAARTHIVILDGTLSRLDPGQETNAGLTYLLLREVADPKRLTIYYEPGLHWETWRDVPKVMTGSGLADQIRRAYGVIASRYSPGDRIILMGYSRGAYAARSLAGAIDQVGLLRADKASERNIRQAWRLYRDAPISRTARLFSAANCYPETPIEMVGVWDTVKSLGIVLPVLWRLSQKTYAFHNDQLGQSIRNGFHALAMDERRVAFAPVLWRSPQNWQGHLEQVWFRGCHGDVGGHLEAFRAARPLANIPLVWMLERLELCGVTLPENWQDRFVQDVAAPSVGMNRGYGRLFLMRRRRVIGADRSETFHSSVNLKVLKPNRWSFR